MHIDEGYIKFKCVWHQADFEFPEPLLHSLSQWRSKLYGLDLVGAYDNGIGFGNISVRVADQQFIITGSATGSKPELTPSHYALVTQYQIDQNQVESTGHTKASSEAMSHAALYESSPEICAVIHIHHLELWQKLKGKIPTTDQTVAFGTPDMAWEMIRLYRESDLPEKKILVMGGHQEGLISFGKDLDEAGEVLLTHYRQTLPS